MPTWRALPQQWPRWRLQANEKQMGIVERVSGYGLRTRELDVNGRYIGELHGDGRNLSYVQVELSGNNGFRVQDPYPHH